jgi:hypothetical protein
MELPEITDLPDSSETPDGETKSKDEP